MNANIKLTYLYRDAGNYKLWNETLFSNQLDLSFDQIVNTILKNLIDDQFFISEKWGLPRLSFENFDPELDHSYHEFHEIEIASTNSNPEKDIAELLLTIIRNH